MTEDDIAALTGVMRRSTLVEQVGAYVRGRLDLDTWYQQLLDQYALEKAAFDAHGQGPADEAQYRRHIAPILDGLRHIHRRVDQWLEQQLQAGTWIAFGVKVPMAAHPALTTLLPAQWLLLRLTHNACMAEGGGHRYEAVRVSDLTRLSAKDASKVRGALEWLTEARRAQAEHAHAVRQVGVIDSEAIGREIGAAVDRAIDRKVTMATDPSAPISVRIADVAPDALMRVQVAAMEIPQRPPATTSKPRSNVDMPDNAPKLRPGRPSMMKRLCAQTVLRAQGGQQADSIGEESRQLRMWALGTRQDGDPPVPLAEAIENGIRDDYWESRERYNGIKGLMADNK